MFELFKKVWDDTKSRFRPANWFCLLFLLAIAVASLVQAIIGVPSYESHRAAYYIVGALLFFATVLGPAYRVARDERERGIFTTLVWGFLGMVVFLATFVAVFLALAPVGTAASSVGTAVTYSRLLNVVPAVVAVWVAGLGWYVHHQISMRGHRTNHAFDLIMQTRTNSEYVNNLRTFQLVYPPGKSIEETAVIRYMKEGITGIPALRRLSEHNQSTAPAREEAHRTIAQLEAIHAGKYLLNYFEFMARGIESGDLDEKILYDTIAPTVIDIFERSDKLVGEFKKSQPLAMQFLTPLVKDWDKRKKHDSANM